MLGFYLTVQPVNLRRDCIAKHLNPTEWQNMANILGDVPEPYIIHDRRYDVSALII